jgi:hypothetical protein
VIELRSDCERWSNVSFEELIIYCDGFQASTPYGSLHLIPFVFSICFELDRSDLVLKMKFVVTFCTVAQYYIFAR